MTKHEMITQLAELAQEKGTELKQSDVRVILESLVDLIATRAKAGEETVIHGLGKFSVKERAARQGRNPQTGETLNIAARNQLVFKPTQSIKDEIA